MDKHEDILAGAERAFEAEGFRGIGVDKILAQSGASTRTLYKHFGSRDGLVIEVLRRRHREFMKRLAETDSADPVGELFEIQIVWIDEHRNSGCLFLRAHGEYAFISADVTAIVLEHKKEFESEIARRVEIALGRPDPVLAMQIWLLFEGATALASLQGTYALATAKDTAKFLLRSRLEHAS
jgi:AcrR family transcriptional regulator